MSVTALLRSRLRAPQPDYSTKVHKDYHYQPLDYDSSAIRLISILPGESFEPIQLIVHTISLEDVEGQYDAISYEWGPAGGDGYALIDGKRIALRDNIWRFLKHCRDTSLGDKLHHNLWIDAVCIDQTCAMEKNHQVWQMAGISSQASRTISWLGYAKEQSSLSKEPCAHECVHSTNVSRLWSLQSRSQQRRGTSVPLCPTPHCQKLISARLLVDSSYWQRLWIVQELQLAQEVDIISDTGLVPFLVLASILKTVWTLPPEEFKDCGIAREQLDRVLTAVQGRSRRSYLPPRLAETAWTYRTSLCADPRDHIFGILGLIDVDLRCTVDYSMSLEGLFFHCLASESRMIKARHSTSGNSEFCDIVGCMGYLLETLNLTTVGLLQDPALKCDRQSLCWTNSTVFGPLPVPELAKPHLNDRSIASRIEADRLMFRSKLSDGLSYIGHDGLL